MQKKLEITISKFSEWLNTTNYISYDQYDFWSTVYGKWAKKVYYDNKKIGTLFVAPIFLLELLLPSSRKLFVPKRRFPIADAHLIMGFLNLFLLKNEKHYLSEAKKIADDLLVQSISGYSGYCWGYPFDWMTNRGLWPKDLPLITSTPYAFEAFLSLYDVTKEQKYLDIAHSIAEFAYNDINETKIDDETSASSYSPIDKSLVNNASAYNGFLHIEAYKRFGEEKFLHRGRRFINFVINNQREDGSWLYAINNPQDEFIDNFHTCFVLKNLYKANLVLKENKISNSIKNGYEFYRKELFYDKDTPKPYAHLKRINFIKIELYDYAEGINLGCLLKDEIPTSFDLSIKLANDILENFVEKIGYFTTHINFLGIKNRIPYLRWAQAQMFFALTTLLSKMQRAE